MSRLQPLSIELTESQRFLLQQVVRREKSTQQQVRRAKVIWAAAEHVSNRQISMRFELTLQTVRRWRRRWLQVSKAMKTAEENGDTKQVAQLILESLSDEPRSGRPAVFTPEQVCQIVAMACETPEDSERPISNWTARELADEAIKRGIVINISPRSAARFFRGGRS